MNLPNHNEFQINNKMIIINKEKLSEDSTYI